MASNMKALSGAIPVNIPQSKSAQNGTSAPSVNRKKQKRRQKQALGRENSAQRSIGDESEEDEGDYLDDYAAQAPSVPTQHVGAGPSFPNPAFATADQYRSARTGEYNCAGTDNRYAYDPASVSFNGTTSPYDERQGSARRGTKKKHGNMTGTEAEYHHPLTYPHPRSAYSHLARSNLPPRPISEEALRTVQRKVKDPIWDTSTSEERARIKEFWLALGENQRRSLVKIEKEAVLRKMKEQQKHSCSCTVCGRKRNAIEEELEVLYDAYYEELEQFANNNPNHAHAAQLRAPPHSTREMLPPPRIPAADQTLSGKVPNLINPRKVPRGRIQELPDDADDYAGEEPIDEEEYDTQDDDYDAEDPDDHGPIQDELPPSARDFFTFGNSLTVQGRYIVLCSCRDPTNLSEGGILTVADDLLKNDGQKFIDMMEQLAERRMQREDVSQYPPYNIPHAPLPPVHTHSQPSEDEYDDEDEDEDYGSEDDDYEEEDDTVCNTVSGFMSQAKKCTGHDDGGPTHARRSPNVSDICGTNV